jgi:transcriptional regulator with XRE-family HTH domain
MSTLNNDKRRVFTANFCTLLQAGDWTQMEAAEQLGISQGSVSDFTAGKRVPSIKGLESIAYRLGIAAEAFTSRRISLDHMAKLLAGGRALKIYEARVPYRAAKPYDPWLGTLRQRWKRSPESRDEIRVAVRMLFGRKARAVVGWLEGK